MAQAPRIKGFVSRLFSNPALARMVSLQKEEQVLQVIRASGRQILSALASMGAAGSQDSRAIMGGLLQEVREQADTDLEGELSLLGSRLTFASLAAFSSGREAPQAARGELDGLLRRIARSPEARRGLCGPLAAVLGGLPARYAEEIASRKKYIHSEVSRVERLALPVESLQDLLSLFLLLRPTIQLFTATEAEQQSASIPEQIVAKAAAQAARLVPSVPAEAVRRALRSHVAFRGDPSLEASARLTAVLALRGRTYVPGANVDRGADSPDKSWFNVSRKNARYHGLDPRMLDELYTIAAENGW
jgi:hypothetical protein